MNNLIQRLSPYYIRIQPAGLDVANHKSMTSLGNEIDGVFAWPACNIEEALEHGEGYDYGDEVLILTGEESATGDLEGYCLSNPQVVARFSWEELVEGLGEDIIEDWDTGMNGYIIFTDEAQWDDLHLQRLVELIDQRRE